MKQAGNTCKKRWTDESWDILQNGLERFHKDTSSAEKNALRDKKYPPSSVWERKGEAERAALLTSQTAGPRLHITLFPHNESQKPQLSMPAHTEPPAAAWAGWLPAHAQTQQTDAAHSSPCAQPAAPSSHQSQLGLSRFLASQDLTLESRVREHRACLLTPR